MSAIIEKIDLHCTDGSSDKVYHVAIKESGSGYDVIFAYGRRGSILNRGAKNSVPVSLAKATSEYRNGGSLYQPQYEGERSDIYPFECTPSQLHYYDGFTDDLDEAA